MTKKDSGNSGNSGKKIKKKTKLSSCAVWDFRANEDYYKSEQLVEFFKKYAKRYAFQKEKADSGYIHYQGRFSLVKKRTKLALLDILKSQDMVEPNYLEPTCKKNHKEDFFYCFKEDTRVGDLFVDPYHSKKYEAQTGGQYIPRQFRNLTLRPFQKQILDSANDFNYRTINVCVDLKGNVGRSTVASLGELLHGAIDAPLCNDYKELISSVCNICMDTDNRSPGIIFFDMPRALSKTQLHGFYSAIEQIKKGKLYDMRHHYKSYWIDSPAVWVFTNEMPDLSLVSSDRWVIHTINCNYELVPYKPEESSTKKNPNFKTAKKFPKSFSSDFYDSEEYINKFEYN